MNTMLDYSMIVRPGSNVSTIHGECMEMLIQCTEKANGDIKERAEKAFHCAPLGDRCTFALCSL